jgi:outer membrane protein insertion porin family
MWGAALALGWFGALAVAASQPVVRSVTFEAPPELRARLERYVTISPGQPLDPESVRHTVELLHATGELADVIVDAVPEGDGLNVILRPVPAPLMAGVEVVGQRVVGPKDVRRIARLQNREPLWPARLDAAAREVALSLVGQGFLEARVNASAEPTAGGARAVFAVTAGPRVRVREARVVAPDPFRARLAGFVAPRAGQVWSRARAEKAAERMRRDLVDLGRGRASVELRDSYDPGTARVSLEFVADPGPRTLARFEGERLPAALRGSVERRLREAGYAADALGEAADLIETSLIAKGHRTPRVQYDEATGPGLVAFVYTVEPGPLATVASVRIPGWPEAAAEPGPLLATRPGEPLLDSGLDEDQRTLTRALEEAGFVEGRVELEAPEGGGPVPVVFRARPGTRTLVGSVTLEGAPEGFTPPPLRSQAGTPLRLRALGEDRATLTGALRDAGYRQGQVTTDVQYGEDRSLARVRLVLQPGTQTRLQRIVIAGLERTREVVVRRELRLREGEPLGLSQVIESQKRIAQLGLFDRVTLREIDPARPGDTSVVVDLHETGRTSVAYGIGYSERELLRGSIEATLRNLSGMNRSLSLFARLSFRGSRLYATFREPHLFDREQELFVTGFREEESREEFDYTRYGGFVQTARLVTKAWTLIGRLGYQHTKTYDITVPEGEIDREYLPSTFAGPAASFVRDTRDDPLEPRKGTFLGGDVQLSLPALGADGYVKAFFQASGFRPLSARTLLALNARVGVARTFGTDAPLLPQPDRFFAGGDYSLRGWAVDSVDYEGGNGLLLGSAEIRFDVGRSIALAAFTDSGNVYPVVSDMGLDDLLYSVGLGLRYKTAVGPLRVDWGYKLNRRPGEKPHELHFTVGHAF